MRRWAVLVTLFASGCASSPYDRAWLDREVTRVTGHAPGEAEGHNRHPWPPGVRDAGALSQDDAVATALWNSPRFQAELAQLGASRADLAEAGALPNPTLSFLLPIGPRQLEASVTYPVGALIQMPFRVAAAKLDVERTARALVEIALDLVRDVRLAHAEVVLAQRRVHVRQEIEKTLAKIAQLTEARLTAGDASKLEARAARAEALTAADLSGRATADVGIARQRLRRLLGLGAHAAGDQIDAAPPAPLGDRAVAPADLEKIALAARPDVRAAEIAVEAAGARLGWEKAKVVQLFARMDVKPIGSSGGPPLLALPGAQLDIPIFNWNPGGRGRAKAQMEQSAARYLAVRDDVITEVRVARAQLEQARGSLIPWRERVLPLLEENLTSAVRAFEGGAEPYLVVLEAVRRSLDATLRDVELEGDVWRARAALDRAVGKRLDR